MDNIERVLRLFSDDALFEEAKLVIIKTSSGLVHIEITDMKANRVHEYHGEKLNHFGSDIAGALTNLDKMIEELERCKSTSGDRQQVGKLHP